MIIYSATKKEFFDDVDSGRIADRIKDQISKVILNYNNQSEYLSWENSTRAMYVVLNDSQISEDINLAIEYQIPQTSKRVDFLVSGQDDFGKSNIVIIELKQWRDANKTSCEGLVTTFLGGAIRAVTHPSYQAYSYAKIIENFNSEFENNDIGLIPCAYLHNFPDNRREEIIDPIYQDYLKEAPAFLKNDTIELRQYIKKYVKKTDDGESLYKINYGKIRPSKALQDALASMLNGNKEFHMIDEQMVAYSTIKKIVEKATLSRKKHTIIVEGGPGTGKSVIAINLLNEFRAMNVNYVTKNAAPRNVFFEKLKGSGMKYSYVKNLFKGSGSYVDAKPNQFDCLLIDEAHRLNEKSGIYSNVGENQIKELINASLVSVFFIDENQKVTLKDIGSIDQIKYWAEELGSSVYYGDDTKLSSQFRCNGSEGYIAWLDNLLGIRLTANTSFDADYDFRVFDDPNEMRELLREKNKINNKARMIAGYCYNWVTKDNPNSNIYDINLENDFKAKWNFSSTNTWAIDPDSFDEIGCIHTSQGLEFDYIGVIIGKDLIYINGKVETDYRARAHTDYSLKGIKSMKDKSIADTIIRNTYKTLMSRGQKACYIFCENHNLGQYIKNSISGKI